MATPVPTSLQSPPTAPSQAPIEPTAPATRGQLLVHTGHGKGKSSAAFGVLARALGHGLGVAVVQFVKSRTDTGEVAFFAGLPKMRWHVLGAGFTWEERDPNRHIAAARAAWAHAAAYLNDASVDLLILDELTYALTYGWLPQEDVLKALGARRPTQHVIVTGRDAPRALIEAADTVTEMSPVKHAYAAGVPAQRGLEW